MRAPKTRSAAKKDDMEVNSRFAALVRSACPAELANLVAFQKADISGPQWVLFFSARRPLSAGEREGLQTAVQSILPAGVNFCLDINEEAPIKTASELRALLLPLLEQKKPFYARLLAAGEWQYAPPKLTVLLARAGESLQKHGCQLLEELAASQGIRLRAVLEIAQADDTLRHEHQQAAMELCQQAAAQPAASKKETREKTQTASEARPLLLYGKKIAGQPSPLAGVDELTGSLVAQGEVFELEEKPLKDGQKVLLVFSLTDYTGSLACKLFLPAGKAAGLLEDFSVGCYVKVEGQCQNDTYLNERVLQVRSIERAEKPERCDNAPEKRIELHLHTRLSQLDSITSPAKLVAQLKRFGHKAVAITDHGVVQAFPDMEAEVKKQKADIQLIFGMEGYLYNDTAGLSITPPQPLEALTYVVLDVETTGLDARVDQIIELAAVNTKTGETFSAFVNPRRHISEKITNLTGITNGNVADAPPIEEVLPRFLAFARGAVLVGHNAAFDLSFLRLAANRQQLPFRFPELDTMALARKLLPGLKSYRLAKVCAALDIKLENAHRALYDAQATAVAFSKMLELLQQKGVTSSDELGAMLQKDSRDVYHIILLAQNKTGLQNLYRLVSESHLKHFYKRPGLPKSLLEQWREGLLLGSACEAGELFSAVLNKEPHERLLEIARFYDYLEVQPLGNNQFLIQSGALPNAEALQEINKIIIALGEELNLPVVAAGDVHYVNPQDEISRRVILHSQGFSDAASQTLYLHSTEEMLQAFAYLPEETRQRIVIEAPAALAARCEKMQSFPRDRLYTPKMEGAEEEIRQSAYENAYKLYGNPLPALVEARLEKELSAIIRHGFAVLYAIAQKVVAKSLSDGYLVGSRGSVGSSFAATMTNITEVNPLPPHYVCPSCQYSDFGKELRRFSCGIDLPEQACPRCGAPLLRLGYDIPFEVFMGFDGDKAPDIDLNFSGEYQPVIHKYIEDLFGKDNVFRAGTIAGVAEKTAMGYVLKYCEEKQLQLPGAEKRRLAAGCIDVKRTTGQHPGGMVVLPKENSIYEFTPLQYPANDAGKEVITTHFDFNSLHDTMLKLDILGHDDPTTLRMLERLTGVGARNLALDDPALMSLFNSTEAIGVNPEALGTTVATFGLPEFGTSFVRKILIETKPRSVADLVRISGLSHGTDVWTNNAQELVKSGAASLPELICTREDIMQKLQEAGLPDAMAFKIMESVRKGKGLSPEMEEAVSGLGLKSWVIGSLKKIKYMFPKAHAAAYVTMALRFAHYKIYHPQAFYTAYFTVRADDFEVGLMQGGVESLRARIRELHQKPELNAREKGILSMLELAVEMKLRGIHFADLNLYASAARDFIMQPNGRILPPLTSIAGLGEAAALSIVSAREQGPFSSVADIVRRTRASKTVLEMLEQNGCLRGIPQSEQMDFFEMA